jgi:Holliday junction resolvase RusA-like endonuclease
VAQGSKIAGRSKSGRTYVRESNAHALDAWRHAVMDAALAAVGLDTPLPLVAEGPVALHVVFTFTRPRAHFGTGRNARQLKPSAPWYVHGRPDADKLLRAVGDALTGVAWRDDGQVASVRVAKVYGPLAQAWVEVKPLLGARLSGAPA